MNRIELDFLQKNGYYKFPPILQIEVTNKCPLNCPQCYKDIRNEKEIEWELIERTIQEGAQNGLKCILINGGEPLSYSKFWDLLDLLRKYDIKAHTYISGAGVTNQFAQKIKEYNIKVNISLNGSTLQINSLSRDGYEVALKAMEIFKYNNVNYGINWVARSDNLKDFKNILYLGELNNADSILIVGNKMTHLGTLVSPLKYDELEELVKEIRDYEKGSGKLRIDKQRCFTELCDLYFNSYNKYDCGCQAGFLACTMDINGRFSPCSHLNYPEKFESVEKYWHHSDILTKLRANLSTNSFPCSACSNRIRCRFCKAEDVFTHDDFSVGKRNCIFFKRKGFFNEVS